MILASKCFLKNKKTSQTNYHRFFHLPLPIHSLNTMYIKKVAIVNIKSANENMKKLAMRLAIVIIFASPYVNRLRIHRYLSRTLQTLQHCQCRMDN